MHGTRNLLTFFINSGTKKYGEILATLYLSAVHLRRLHITDLFLSNVPVNKITCLSIVINVGLRVPLK